MTKAEAGKIVAMITTMWPVPAWTEDAVVLWAELLQDLDRDATARVVKQLMQTSADRPSVAQIRREVAKEQAASVGETFLPPDEAWAYVMRCFGSVGQYREFPADHALVKKAVDGIGWQEMCRSENLDVIRGQFRMAYTALLERSITEVAASEGAALLPQILRPQIGMH